MKKPVPSLRPLCVAAAAFLLASHTLVTHAQVPPFELQPVSVTGSRMARTLGSEIAATSVLTRGDIERSGARDAVSILSMLGTVLVEQQGGPGTLASVRIRGADTRDTLVLVDGVPLTDVTSGQSLIQQIPAEMIERVEVVRGNLSALYGANATGGVIQIFTRRGEKGAPRPHVSAGAGSRGTRSLSASVAGGSEVFSARVGVGSERTDGFSAADPAASPTANPDADGNKRQHATLAVDADIAAGQHIALDLRRVEGTVQYDSISSFSTPADTHRQHLVQTGASLRGDHALQKNWTFGWRWSEADEKRNDGGVSSGAPFAFDNSLHNRVLDIELDGVIAPGWRTQLGVQKLSQSTDIPTYTRRKRDTDVLRAGTVYAAAWGSLQANVRHDRTSDFGSATTGLVGVDLNLGSGWSAVATAASSFTPPTLDFLFYDCAPFICSNSALRPEKAHNVEAALQWQDAHTLARATLFAVRYHDKIANDANFVPQNLDRVKNNGLELSVRHAVGVWTLLGEASFQNPVDEASGERLIRRARHQLALRADYQKARWHAGVGLRHIGDRPDSGGATAGAYTVVDASAHWSLTPQWTLQGSVENLFDRHYAPTIGYNGRPRGIFVGVNWSPKS
jgi:vitamin B12 transporter